MEYDEKVALTNRISRLEEKIKILADFIFTISYLRAPIATEETKEKYRNIC